MKKLKKIFFLTTCIILISGLICTNSTAMSDTLKEKINFKTVEDDGKPSKYDVLVDGSKLLQTVRIPQISVTIEKVLYGHNDLMDIKLLTGNNQSNTTETNSGSISGKENKNPFWINIKNLTQTVFKVSFYIATATMLMLLLYVAFIVISSTLKTGESDLEEEKQKSHGRLIRKTVLKNLKDKLFIQEWIIGVISLGLLPLVINLTIYLSDYIMFTSPISIQSEESIDEGDIVVYVKGGSFPIDEESISGSTSTNSNGLITSGNAINLGYTLGDFYFTTNIEGLLALLTYYQGLDTLALFASWSVIICKMVLLIMFLLRVYILGIIIAISPILVVINTFKKINKENGFLKKWIGAFLYLVFLRPILYMVYYAFIKIRGINISAEPVFLIFFSFVMITICIVTAGKAFKSMFNRGSRTRR